MPSACSEPMCRLKVICCALCGLRCPLLFGLTMVNTQKAETLLLFSFVHTNRSPRALDVTPPKRHGFLLIPRKPASMNYIQASPSMSTHYTSAVMGKHNSCSSSRPRSKHYNECPMVDAPMAGASTVVKPTRMVNKCPQGLDSPPGNNYMPNYTTVRDLCWREYSKTQVGYTQVARTQQLL